MATNPPMEGTLIAPASYAPHVMATLMVMMDEIARSEIHRSGCRPPSTKRPPVEESRIDSGAEGTIIISIKRVSP